MFKVSVKSELMLTVQETGSATIGWDCQGLDITCQYCQFALSTGEWCLSGRCQPPKDTVKFISSSADNEKNEKAASTDTRVSP